MLYAEKEILKRVDENNELLRKIIDIIDNPKQHPCYYLGFQEAVREATQKTVKKTDSNKRFTFR